MGLFESGFWRNLWRDSGLGERDRLNCMFEGIICEHVSVNLNDWRCCCTAVCECLCIRHSACCLRGAPFKSVGYLTNTTEGEYCRLTFPCCDCAFIRPRMICGRASQCFCIHNSGAFPPFDNDYLPQPVCAYYCVSCWPKVGICVPPPRSKALEKLLNPGVEHIATLDSIPPDGEEMDRINSIQSSEYMRKNSDDGMQMV